MECNFENCPNFERLGKKFADRISELEQENEALIEGLGVANKYVNKYHQTLQEIKAIAEQSNVDCIYRISVIRKILTKAEEE